MNSTVFKIVILFTNGANPVFSPPAWAVARPLGAHTSPCRPPGTRAGTVSLRSCFRAVSTPLGGFAQADSSRCANPFVCLCVCGSGSWVMVWKGHGTAGPPLPSPGHSGLCRAPEMPPWVTLGHLFPDGKPSCIYFYLCRCSSIS